MMADRAKLVRELHALLACEPRINHHRFPISLSFDADTLVLEGDVENVGAKKLAVEKVRHWDGIEWVVDRMRVIPAARRGDGAIRDSVCAYLSSEPVFSRSALYAWVKNRWETLARVDEGSDPSGFIEVWVDNGVVILAGQVISLTHKRLAGVLAWWAPGCRDVVNDLEVVPPEEDRDDEVADAVRIVLEKDPLVHADQIGIQIHDHAVTLAGVVGSEEERRMAEQDTWCICGVTDVVNRIQVQAGRRGATF